MTAPHHPLTVLQASCHGPSVTHRTIRFALSRHFSACAVAFSEAYRHTRFLHDREAWRVTVPHVFPEDDRETWRGKGDAPVLVRRHHPMVDAWSMKACRRSVPVKLAPPRYFNGQTLAHELGAVEVMAAHPHAKVQGLPITVDRVEQYAHSMGRLEQKIERALDLNRLPVILGDLNHPDTGQAGPPWAPARVFARHGLKSWAVGVDWIAYHPSLVPIGNQVIGRAQTGQDHPWLWAKFTGFRHP